MQNSKKALLTIILQMILTVLVPFAKAQQLIPDSKKLSDTMISQEGNSLVKQKDTIATTENLKVKKIDTKIYKAGRAAWYSAVCPGLGQIYNKRYWKVPIVYTLLGGTLVWTIFNVRLLNKYNSALYNSYRGLDSGLDQNYDITQITQLRDFYRKQTHFSILAMTGVYALNIIDAAVDAHLKKFNISDDLTLQISPTIIPTYHSYAPGIRLTLHL